MHSPYCYRKIRRVNLCYCDRGQIAISFAVDMAHPPAPQPLDGCKACKACKIRKPLAQFHKIKSGMYGVVAHCSTCANACKRARYRDDPSRKALHAKCGKQWREENRERAKFITWRSALKRQYGLTHEEYLRQVGRQDSRCALCKLQKKLVIDHNHKTEQFRALLCRKCNAGLGQFDDNPAMLERAARYLRKHAQTQFEDSGATSSIRQGPGKREDHQGVINYSWIQ